MNNESVAWMREDGVIAFHKQKEVDSQGYKWIPLYTHPVKELHLSLQKDKETGELLAVTYTDDEHRIVEVLWQRPPVKELNDGGEPVKNATYWKRQYNLMATQNDNLKSGLYHANEQIKYLESQIEALKKDLAKYDELAIDDLNGKRTVWCACGDSIPPNSGALCGNCVSARPSQTLLTMTFEEMYPIAEKHLGHAIGLYNWKIFGDAILRKAQE